MLIYIGDLTRKNSVIPHHINKYQKINHMLMFHEITRKNLLHVLVTGHNPLKIYIHTDGFVKLSSEIYDLDLKNLVNVYKHITNMSLKKKIK